MTSQKYLKIPKMFQIERKLRATIVRRIPKHLCVWLSKILLKFAWTSNQLHKQKKPLQSIQILLKRTRTWHFACDRFQTIIIPELQTRISYTTTTRCVKTNIRRLESLTNNWKHVANRFRFSSRCSGKNQFTSTEI